MTREQAERLAIDVLSYIASQPSTFQDFLSQTGLSPDAIMANAGDADFLAGVVDFLLSDEAKLLDFCQTSDIDPTLPAKARQALPGATYI